MTCRHMTDAARMSTRGDTRQAEGNQRLRAAGGGFCGAGGPGESWRPDRGEGRDVTSANDSAPA